MAAVGDRAAYRYLARSWRARHHGTVRTGHFGLSPRSLVLAGYAGLAGFFVLEVVYRKPSACNLEASEADRGTTRLIVLAYALASAIPLVSRRRRLRPLPSPVAPVGLVLQALGLAVRATSMQTLGGSYTRTLRVEDAGQRLIDYGPYRWVRHPGYLGSLLNWTGFALASRSPLSAVLIPALLGAAYRQRIAAEELLLRNELQGYAAYCERTNRLIPFIW